MSRRTPAAWEGVYFADLKDIVDLTTPGPNGYDTEEWRYTLVLRVWLRIFPFLRRRETPGPFIKSQTETHLYRRPSTWLSDFFNSMTSLTTNPIPGFFGQYCAVVPKADHSGFIAVGVTPGQAWANAKIALALQSDQLRELHEIIRLSEEQYRTATTFSEA
jgi:hypothetical protein